MLKTLNKIAGHDTDEKLALHVIIKLVLGVVHAKYPAPIITHM